MYYANVLSTIAGTLSVNTAMSPENAHKTFNIGALVKSSGKPHSDVMASQSSLWIQYNNPSVECDGGVNSPRATFQIVDGSLSLYSTQNTPQTVYVDTSPKGRGRISYTRSGGAVPANAGAVGWAVDKKGDLLFHGHSIVACETEEGPWPLYVSSYGTEAGGNSKCIDIIALALIAESPVSCTYDE